MHEVANGGWGAVRAAAGRMAPLEGPVRRAFAAGASERQVKEALGVGFLSGALGDLDGPCFPDWRPGHHGECCPWYALPECTVALTAHAAVQSGKAVAYAVTHPKQDIQAAANAAHGFLTHTLVGNAVASPFNLVGATGVLGKKVQQGSEQQMQAGGQRAKQAVSDLGKAAASIGQSVAQGIGKAINDVGQLLATLAQFAYDVGALLLDLIQLAILAGTVQAARWAKDWTAVAKMQAQQRKVQADMDPLSNGSTMQNLIMNPGAEAAVTLIFGLLMLPFIVIGAIGNLATHIANANALNVPNPFDPTTPVRILRHMVEYVRVNGDTPQNRHKASQYAFTQLMAGIPLSLGTIFHLATAVVSTLPVPGPAMIIGIIMSDHVLASKVAAASGASSFQARQGFHTAAKVAGAVAGSSASSMTELIISDVIYPLIPCNMGIVSNGQPVTGLANTMAFLGLEEQRVVDLVKKLWKYDFNLKLLFDDAVNPGGAQHATDVGVVVVSAIIDGISRSNHPAVKRPISHFVPGPITGPQNLSMPSATTGPGGSITTPEVGRGGGQGTPSGSLAGLGDLSLGGQLGINGVEALILSILSAGNPKGARAYAARFAAGVTIHNTLATLNDLSLPIAARLSQDDHYAALYYFGKNHWYPPAALSDMQVSPVERQGAQLGGLGSYIDFANSPFPIPDGTQILPKIASSDLGLAFLVALAESFPSCKPALGQYLVRAHQRMDEILHGAESAVVNLAEHLAANALAGLPGFRQNVLQNNPPTALPAGTAAIVKGPYVPPMHQAVYTPPLAVPQGPPKTGNGAAVAGGVLGFFAGGPLGVVAGAAAGKFLGKHL